MLYKKTKLVETMAERAVARHLLWTSSLSVRAEEGADLFFLAITLHNVEDARFFHSEGGAT